MIYRGSKTFGSKPILLSLGVLCIKLIIISGDILSNICDIIREGKFYENTFHNIFGLLFIFSFIIAFYKFTIYLHLEDCKYKIFNEDFLYNTLNIRYEQDLILSLFDYFGIALLVCAPLYLLYVVKLSFEIDGNMCVNIMKIE